MKSNILIVGSTSNIGHDFIVNNKSYFNVFCSSRNHNDRNQIDLSSYVGLPTSLPFHSIEYALICSSIVDIAYCEANYGEARLVNFENTLRLINDLNFHGIKCIFLSSTAVFSQNSILNSELSRCDPSINYGFLKHKVEDEALKSSLNTVIRATKVISPYNTLLSKWKKNLREGISISAFNDLYVAPVPTNYFTNYLYDHITNRRCGLFHVTSDRQISYYSLAIELAKFLSVDPSLVHSIPSNTVLGNSAYSPQKAHLDCIYTFSKAYNTYDCINEIFKSIKICPS